MRDTATTWRQLEPKSSRLVAAVQTGVVDQEGGGSSGWGELAMVLLSLAWPVATYLLFARSVLAGYAGDHDGFMGLLTVTGVVMVVIPAASAVIAGVIRRPLAAAVYGLLAGLCALFAFIFIGVLG